MEPKDWIAVAQVYASLAIMRVNAAVAQSAHPQPFLREAGVEDA